MVAEEISVYSEIQNYNKDLPFNSFATKFKIESFEFRRKFIEI